MLAERKRGGTYRFEKDLSRVTENEGETEDDRGERYERRQGVRRIEDEEGDEHDDDKCDSEEDRIQFRESRTRVLYAVDEGLSFLVNSLDCLSHLFLADVTVSVLVKYFKCGVLGMGSAGIQGQKNGGNLNPQHPRSSGSTARSLSK